MLVYKWEMSRRSPFFARSNRVVIGNVLEDWRAMGSSIVGGVMDGNVSGLGVAKDEIVLPSVSLMPILRAMDSDTSTRKTVGICGDNDIEE